MNYNFIFFSLFPNFPLCFLSCIFISLYYISFLSRQRRNTSRALHRPMSLSLGLPRYVLNHPFVYYLQKRVACARVAVAAVASERVNPHMRGLSPPPSPVAAAPAPVPPNTPDEHCLHVSFRLWMSRCSCGDGYAGIEGMQGRGESGRCSMVAEVQKGCREGGNAVIRWLRYTNKGRVERGRLWLSY